MKHFRKKIGIIKESTITWLHKCAHPLIIVEVIVLIKNKLYSCHYHTAALIKFLIKPTYTSDVLLFLLTAESWSSKSTLKS